MKTAKEIQKVTRQVPHNLKAEQSVLGCILFDYKNESIQDRLHELSCAHFYSEANRLVFEAMEKIAKTGGAIDLVTVSDELEKSGNLAAAGGMNYLIDVSQSVFSTADFKFHLEIVLRDGVLRKLIQSATDIIVHATGDTSAESARAYAEKVVLDISADEKSQLSLTDFSEILEHFNEIEKNPNAFRGIKTHIENMDNWFNGMHKGDLVLIAARPSFGKTSLAMNIVENMSCDGRVCAVFSLEMPRQQLQQRMLCSMAEVSLSKATRGEMEMRDWRKINTATNKLNEAKIYIDDSPLTTVPEILSKCRRLKAKEGLDIIMVDYIQLMSGSKVNAENRQQEISEISRGLKILAKELEVPVLALSQLSRAVEKRQSNRPVLSDLRESGAIEQDADIVMFIHRPDRVEENLSKLESGKVEKNVAEIIVAKHRNGECGTFKLRWLPEFTKFVNYVDLETDAQAAAYLPPQNLGLKEDKDGDNPF